ncbi:adenylyl-sulfate kinase [Flavobacterium sp. AC]|uniref:Adenylyl-sulfate kinase n=1 Tax=Flavobacterium azizsancarii TaxID=2961580 RepID=A0ABT4W8W3_9FLAO|nr:adenylyl-sulfate kinase [Flavobacterium azizsancarii]MDA6068560.1 adenylyl-sulfate kinase [Flavobacterium azizsancarii]
MILIQFTGLSGAGKTTLAQNVRHLLLDKSYKVEIVDGDVYRKTICRDLGFSREDRCENIRRLFNVAQNFVREDTIVLMSVINPYESLRNELRTYEFVRTVYLDCSISNLIKRDPKGLYKQALLPDNDPNKISHFTGISDVFEIPSNADLVLKTDVETEIFSTNRLYSFIISNLS